MGLLDRYYALNNPLGGVSPMLPAQQPFMPQQQPPMQRPPQPALPPAPSMAQLTPPPAPASPMTFSQTPSWGQRFTSAFDAGPDGTGGVFNNPMFQMGMGLLAASENGGDWSVAAQQANQIGQQQMQRAQMQRQNRREDATDQREQTQFGWQQSEQQLRQQRVADWQGALAREQDPMRQAQLRAIGPDGYAQFLLSQQQQEFQAREGQLDRDANLRAAQARAANENPLGRMFQSMDAQQLGAMNQRAAILTAQTLPALRQVRENILQAGQAATGQPIDYTSRIVLNRVFNGQGADRQALETWRARILRPALEMLPPGPATDRDVALVMENFANPNMQLGSALSLIDERIAAAEREAQTAQAANDFFGVSNGLTGVRNPEGQDWPTFLSTRLADAPGIATNESNSVPRGGYSDPPSAAITELRRDTSAAARAEFDQMFGPGAAARALSTPARQRQQGVREGQMGPREGQRRTLRARGGNVTEVYRNGRWVRE